MARLCTRLLPVLLAIGSIASGEAVSSKVPERTLTDLLSVDAPDRSLPAGPFDLTPLLVEGQPAPGREPLLVDEINSVGYNRSGTAVISTQLDDPSTPESDRIFAVFVDDGGQPRPLPLEEAVQGGRVEINERSSVAVLSNTRFTVLHEGGTIFSVAAGDLAPVAGEGGDPLTFETLRWITRTLNDRDELGFVAELSDGSRGLFVASREGVRLLARPGDPVAGRPDRALAGTELERAEFLSNDGSIVLADNRGVVVADGSGLTGVALAGDLLDSGLLVESLQWLDADDAGRILLTVNEDHLLLWQACAFTSLVGPGTRLPGLAAGSFEFQAGYLVPGGPIYFTAVDEATGGIFLVDGDALFKVAVDGDRTAGGEPFQVSVRVTGFGAYDGRRIINFPRPASAGQAIFSSSAGPLVWRRGQLLSFDLEGLASDTGTRPLVSLLPIASDTSGRILVRATQCCDTRMVFRVRDAEPRLRHLPYLAVGAGFQTTIEALNLSPFAARVMVELYDSAGSPLREPEQLVFPPGSNSVFLSRFPRPVQGFARLTVDNGARVALSSTVDLLDGDFVLSSVTIPGRDPSPRAEFLFEGALPRLALALSNPGADPMEIGARLLDAEGAVAATAQITLEPLHQRSLYLPALFTSAQHQGAGRLLLDSDGPFLATLLKQSGVQLAYLPPLEELPPEVRYGFVNVFPSEVRLGPVRANRQGTIAFSTDRRDRAEVWVGGAEGFVRILPGDGFPPDSGTVPPYHEASLWGINDAGQVLFSAGDRDGVLRDVLLWDGGVTRKLVELDPAELFRVAALGDTGVVALGGSRLTVIQDTVRDFPVDGPITHLDVNGRGDVAFTGAAGVGVYQDGRLVVAAAAERLPGTERADSVSLSQTAINERREVFFRAAWRRNFALLGTGLFASVERVPRLLLQSGQPLPAHPEWTIARVGEFELDRDGYPVVDVEVFDGLSRQSVALIRALPSGERLETVLLADPELRILSFRGVSFGPGESLAVHAWQPERGFSAWVWDGRELFPVLSAGERVPGQRARPGAFPRGVSYVRMLETGAIVSNLELAGTPVAGIFLGEPRLQESVIPLFAQGRFGSLEYQSHVLLANRGEVPASVQVEIFASGGELVGRGTFPELAAGAVLTLPLEAGEPLLGWIRVQSSAPVAALLQLSVSGAAAPRGEVFLEAALLQRAGHFRSFALAFTGQDTAAALVNPFGRMVTAELEVRDSSGRSWRRQLEIQPGRQATFLHSRDADLSGAFRVRSDFPLPAAALRIANRILSVLPVR